MVMWLLSEGCPGRRVVLEEAAKGGHADTLEQLLAAGCPWSDAAAGAAAAGGRVSLMRRLLQLSKEQPEQRPTDPDRLLCGAAEGLGFAALQPLHAEYMPQIPAGEAAAVGKELLQRVALANTADYQLKVDWLLSLGYKPGDDGPFLGGGRLVT